MENIIVRGGKTLQGEVKVDGAKNAVLPILAATLLASEGKNVINNVPLLSDVYIMKEVLSYLDADVQFDESKQQIEVVSAGQLRTETPFELVSKMRASVVVMGPLLARFGHVKVAMPGGCAIGTRPIDLHIKGFEALGAEVSMTNGYVEAQADQLVGADIYLDFPSVGATENIMMAAVLAEGVTTIENVAKEPEIVDLANYLNRMGAQVQGAGTDTIKITGVQTMHGTDHCVIPDRIEAGTFILATAVAGGEVLVKDALVEHNLPLISKLREMGVEIVEEMDAVFIKSDGHLKATNVKTLPYPGFPTDLQAPFTIAQIRAEGNSIMEETVFENRFMHLEELRRMDAQFKIHGDTVSFEGPSQLQAANVQATDLRAAAALIIAGLVAEGTTVVSQLQYLDRGYHHLEDKLHALGADIKRIDADELRSRPAADFFD
ncbi:MULTISPECIES: UDP-N-acetylglucosamine 1-carboxyvinyltransferase [Aerococcus]|uniref:UDP-N-acetylglucosamine 1-carboxyvinyltransferase n=1 Tax=Aerococcus sanguinicola TaxID=119206 RepID=A0A5N1GLA3_9LACT|nr:MULTISPECIES: UDP-N-acetylglucosamine 1-carboxyvinyltransferase [Aerococcus]KAA9301763.1 UDP-N-acetylglucosamine 1-carboxyvinyltransferase [Aerococcus sanguinicola]MDK6368821.1 UDP-N-acetylglucosamine 1-carboxyvinyltransferase [Aerococcus sp. UMB9870]MDK6679420.1 UDP-N-acetylglucosamine 1-carboxyvinyltransferase [Aerococcus sp. UMB8608]MDK6685736.1 UDP-N-acetylglucosamine 1-carboxyvinyltransferase [Aerococcus sp. UMB8623]MDK6939445.1 UDP-N-acetylglucosamine 1-carboxyvinyltransferase [Aeroco